MFINTNVYVQVNSANSANLLLRTTELAVGPPS